MICINIKSNLLSSADSTVCQSEEDWDYIGLSAL